MLELLEQLFRQVYSYLHSERFDRNRVYSHTSHHTTMQFDHDAEDIIINGLMESGHTFEVITEERPTFTTSPNPTYRIVIDPVDGSTNVSRGIMTAAVSLAVLPIDKPISPENVEYALVGELFSGIVYKAQRSGGAFCNGQPCHVSNTKELRHCLMGLNFDGRDLDTLRRLIIDKPAPSKVRRTGSSAMDVVYIANGAYDAYIDIGDVISAESFLAASSIVLEAGGILSDQHGKNLHAITGLDERFSLVIACTQELHSAILNKIKY